MTYLVLPTGFKSATSLVLQRWQGISLARQFAIASSVVVGCCMAIVGTWVSARIETGVVHNTAAPTALFVDSFVEPHVQELATGAVLSPEAQRALDALLAGTAISKNIAMFKVWGRDGTVAYSNRKDLIGKSFPATKAFRSALNGVVAAEFDRLHDDAERQMGVPMLEVYAPLRQRGSGRVIAVAEFYEIAGELQAHLRQAMVQSWAVVGAVTVLMLGLLFGIVQRGSHTIARHEQALEQRVDELSVLLSQNEDLRRRLAQANHRAAVINERFLRRVGADLHDGPAQLIGLALLRLDALKSRLSHRPTGSGPDDLETVRGALVDSLKEIRNLSAGLALPELEAVSPAEAIAMAARSHERRTGSSVTCEIGDLPNSRPPLLNMCLYRFTQEGLNNAFRHAGGKGQTVRAICNDENIEIEVSDAGPGFDPNRKPADKYGLGLAGLRERIESLGGTLYIRSQPGGGARLTARFKVSDAEEAYG